MVGYKPSQGRVVGAGVKSLSPTLDVIGGFGRSVRDVALLGAVLTGDLRLLEWPRARRAAHRPVPDAGLAAGRRRHAERLGAGHAGAGPHTDACQDVAMPQDFGDLIQLQKDVMTFEMARSLSHERLRHREALSAQLVALLDAGMAINGATHDANLQRTADWRLRIDALFERHDVLLTPSTIGEAPEGLAATGDPLFCRSWSLLGLPCVHLPFATRRHGLAGGPATGGPLR